MHDPVAVEGDNACMHDKPHTNNPMAADASLDGLIAELGAADPAEAPDLADAVADQLESGLGQADSTEAGQAG